MIPVFSGKEIRKIESYAINDIGIPAEILMENAATSAVCVIEDVMKDMKNKKVTILCGSGNNGGDGLAVARQLFLKDINVSVFLIGRTEKFKPETAMNYEVAKKINLPVYPIKDDNDIQSLKDTLDCSGVVVDAIFGIGLNSEVKELYGEVISEINRSGKYVIALDIPSGIDADTGSIMGNAVKANETVTFGYGKTGLYAGAGKEYCGKIHVKPISFPKPQIKPSAYILDDFSAADMLPKRPLRSHKGTFGKVYLFAGCSSMPGANVISCASLYKTGAGLVKNCCIESIFDIAAVKCPEAVMRKLPGKNGYLSYESFAGIQEELNEADVIVIGPGLGVNEDTIAFTENIIRYTSCPIVLDADGINILSQKPFLFEYLKTRCIISPHPKEMSGLTGLSVKEILSDTINTAKNFSWHYQIVTLLKDSASIISGTEYTWINTTGNQALAKAGSGDALTGIIGGLVAQGLSLDNAGALGAYIHGRCGEFASEKLGLYGVNATDLVQELPLVTDYLYRLKHR